jgi:peptide chain release factor 1
VLNDQNRYRALTIEHSELIDVVKGYERCCRIREEIAGSQELLRDPDAEVREMANAEVSENDQRNVVLEVRAGTGGDEAALFAGDLFRMYCRYADRQGWKVEFLSTAESEAGGYKEVIALVSGKGVFSRFKYELYRSGDAGS